MERGAPEKHQPKFLELYPSIEDWYALQGGKPRVFRKPNKPTAPWIVLHVYDEHGDPEKRFASGLIVDTLPPKKVELRRVGIPHPSSNGQLHMRDIVVPSFMDRTVHGDVCNNRSASVGGHSYDQITDQRAYEGLVKRLDNAGYEELRFGVSNEGFTLTPQPIRAPRALDRPAE